MIPSYTTPPRSLNFERRHLARRRPSRWLFALVAGLLLIAELGLGTVRADDWPQWRGPARDGVWRETGTVEQLPAGQLPLRWTVEIGSGYSGPTVADGRVLVMDRLVDPQQVERVLCFDAATGKPLWTHSYACEYTVSYTAGPRASVTVDGAQAFSLGAMGHLHCLEVATGKVLWKHDFNTELPIEMPIWGIAGAPLVYRDLVILQIGGENGACAVAVDRQTGELKWKSLSDRAGYSAPMMIRQQNQDVVVFWTGDSVAGLDPLTGQVHWRQEFTPKNMPIGVATPIVHEDRLFVTSFYDGSLMLRVPANSLTVEKLWHRVGEDEQHTDALQSIISTPIWLGNHIYGVDSYGELRCLQADNGDRVWENLSATPKARWSTIHFVRQQKGPSPADDDLIWMFNERGELLTGHLSPAGFRETSRAKLIEPTDIQLGQRGGVCWAHPAFANRSIYIRNDNRLVCASLAAE